MTYADYLPPLFLAWSIQAVGIVPDIVVEQARLETLSEGGIRESDLRGALDVGTNGEAEAASAAEVEDYQLQRALDLIHSISLAMRH